MAPPPWVLLHRIVHFYAGAAVPGGASKNGEGFTVGSSEEAAATRGSSLWPTPREAMAAMKADPVVVDPPEVSYLSMLLRTPRYLSWCGKVPLAGDVSSTDKDIVVLYSDFYRPGDGRYRPNGCYLVYDASNNTLAAIPPIPHLYTMRGLGRSAVALRSGSAVGEYTLADVFTCYPGGLPEATLCVWSPSSAANPDGEWIQTPIRLPLPAHLCGCTGSFNIDVAFTFAGCIVWADLLTGVVICDLSAQGPKLHFIALPEEAGCLKKPCNDRLRLSPETSRSMGCVRGMIKYVALVDYGSWPINEVKLKTWTLCPDLREWKEGNALSVGQIWTSESYTKMELPQILPMCPVLSMNEDGIVYTVINDYELADRIDEFGRKSGEDVVPKGTYIIRLDMMENKVLSSTKISTGDFTWFIPNLVATDFNAYLQVTESAAASCCVCLGYVTEASSKDAPDGSSTSNIQKSTYKKRTRSSPTKNTVKKIYQDIANTIKDGSADDTAKPSP